MSPDLEQRLRTEFAALLADPTHFRCWCGDGWDGLIQTTLRALQSRSGVRVAGIKQKLGLLRIKLAAWEGDDYELAKAATEQSRTICEICGAPGQLARLAGDGYLETTCPQHIDSRQFLPVMEGFAVRP